MKYSVKQGNELCDGCRTRDDEDDGLCPCIEMNQGLGCPCGTCLVKTICVHGCDDYQEYYEKTLTTTENDRDESLKEA